MLSPRSPPGSNATSWKCVPVSPTSTPSEFSVLVNQASPAAMREAHMLELQRAEKARAASARRQQEYIALQELSNLFASS